MTANTRQLRLLPMLALVLLLMGCGAAVAGGSDIPEPQLKPCGPIPSDDYNGTCWWAKEEIAVNDASGEVTMSPTHGPGGPKVSNEQATVLAAYADRFGGAALWDAVSAYNGERLTDSLIETLARTEVRISGPPAETKVSRDTSSTVPTPTPTPAPLLPPGPDTPEIVQQRFDDHPEWWKFAEGDILVRFAYPSPLLDWAGSVFLSHAPSASAAHLAFDFQADTEEPGVLRMKQTWRVHPPGTDEGRAALEAALADEAFMAKLYAWKAALASGGFEDPREVLDTPVIAAWVEQVAGKSRTYHLQWQIIGGPDNNRELYCPGGGWDFGDGENAFVTPMCVPYQPTFRFQRSGVMTHAYDVPGTYVVRRFLGSPSEPVLKATTEVVVE